MGWETDHETEITEIDSPHKAVTREELRAAIVRAKAGWDLAQAALADSDDPNSRAEDDLRLAEASWLQAIAALTAHIREAGKKII